MSVRDLSDLPVSFDNYKSLPLGKASQSQGDFRRRQRHSNVRERTCLLGAIRMQPHHQRADYQAGMDAVVGRGAKEKVERGVALSGDEAGRTESQ
jgi:hypothetical protein